MMLYASSCERPSKSSASVFLPSSVSNSYSFSTGTQGSSRRFPLISSFRSACSDSSLASSTRAACHSSRVPILCSGIASSSSPTRALPHEPNPSSHRTLTGSRTETPDDPETHRKCRRCPLPRRVTRTRIPVSRHLLVLLKIAALSSGDTATLPIEALKDWPEPNVPQDLETALAAAPQKIQDLWKGITPMARWEWVRWVNATPNPDTRKRRVEVSISKMKSGKRRPCCFNLAACTDPNLSKNSRLIESA